MTPSTRPTTWPLVTVVVPTHDHAETLAYSVRSVLAQTMADLCVVIIGDGVTPAVRAEARALCDSDDRVFFEDHPKSPRRGELLRDRLIRASTSRFIAYNCDDDLWFPHHLATSLAHLGDHDFVHPLPVLVGADGVPFFMPSDLQRPESVRWHLTEIPRNTISLSGVVHTRAAYLRLPHGWRTTPEGRWTDHYMWQQFFTQDWFSGVTSPEATTLKLMAQARDDLPPGARRADIDAWWRRLGDPGFAEEWASMVHAALWRSAVDHNVVATICADELTELRQWTAREVAAMRSSRSWRVTAPLRALGSVGRRLAAAAARGIG